MTVSLTFTIEEEEFYKEMANLLQLRGPELQKMVDIFQDLQALLVPEEGDPELEEVMSKVKTFRRALVRVDLRLHEITQMINGFTNPPEPVDQDPLPPTDSAK